MFLFKFFLPSLHTPDNREDHYASNPFHVTIAIENEIISLNQWYLLPDSSFYGNG